MLCVVQVPNLSMAVPVRSNVASHSSAYSSLINQPAGVGPACAPVGAARTQGL